MRTGFYFGLAKDGIRKNRRLYAPYIIACVAMVTLFYIIVSVEHMKYLKYVFGGAAIAKMMGLGSYTVAIFACIFLFYTNSFLMKKRKKEFGLYHILGMGKRHISRILFWENTIVACVGILGGMLAGVLLSKLAELGLVNIMQAEVHYEFYLIPRTFGVTVAIFGILFFVLFLNAVRQIRFSSAVALISSDKTGEKPPKGNWFLGLIGVALLAVAYTISVSIQSPLSALMLFFFAVILVVIGTYLLFISTSVIFCKLLQKNKKYYYQTKHFVSVSTMMYRMKRNGAGLASICILATMVLVMISFTSCLYFGIDDVLNSSYPRDINLEIAYVDEAAVETENVEDLSYRIFESAESLGVDVTHTLVCPRVSFFGKRTGDHVKVAVDVSDFDTEDLVGIYLEPIERYNHYTKENVELSDNEAVMFCSMVEYKEKSIDIEAVGTIQLKKKVNKIPRAIDAETDVVPTIILFVNDINKTLGDIPNIVMNAEGEPMKYYLSIGFDNGLEEEEQEVFISKLWDELRKSVFVEGSEGQNPARNLTNMVENGSELQITSKGLERASYLSLIGGLFYLGIILSIVFLFATVLIIYYKQVSEGFEDQARFEIMQKVGMTQKEIKKNINSQMLTVFFFPLLVAGIHICFAFPMIRKMLLLFLLNNVTLFAIVCLLCFAIFSLFYMAVYKLTSNAYYRIVSGAYNK